MTNTVTPGIMEGKLKSPLNVESDMNVSLTPELESFVTAKVGSGLYGSQSEVVRQGLRLLMERDRMMEARLRDLRTDVAEGLDEARRGELIPGEEVRERIRGKSRQRGK